MALRNARVRALDDNLCHIEGIDFFGDKVAWTMRVDPYKVAEWFMASDPPLVQNEFPELSDDQREFLVTGIKPERWDEIMGDER